MERRDIIKDQIEQLGRVLGLIIAGFIQAKTKGKGAEGLETSYEQFKGQLDLDIREMLDMNPEELEAYLGKTQLTAGQLDELVTYFKEGADSATNSDLALKKLDTALLLLDMAEKKSKTVSFNQVIERSNIEQLMEALRNQSS